MIREKSKEWGIEVKWKRCRKRLDVKWKWVDRGKLKGKVSVEMHYFLLPSFGVKKLKYQNDQTKAKESIILEKKKMEVQSMNESIMIAVTVTHRNQICTREIFPSGLCFLCLVAMKDALAEG